jgi:hypothetical protein
MTRRPPGPAYGVDMTAVRNSHRPAAVVSAALVAAALAGCTTEYHGYHSGIDGTLWRQIAAFEDPLSGSLYAPLANEPEAYLENFRGEHWDGSAESAAELDLARGGVVLYDTASTRSTADLSVFIASGHRPDVATDEGGSYGGPSAVYTCYVLHARFGAPSGAEVDREILQECPAALVELVPADSAFASGEVFDG